MRLKRNYCRSRSEAEALLGYSVSTLDQMKKAASDLYAWGIKFPVIKGGHLNSKKAIDIAYDGKMFYEYQSARFDTTATHGTGCTFSAAIAANLALGMPPLEAIEKAKEYISGAIKHAVPMGHGHGPVNHFWKKSNY